MIDKDAALEVVRMWERIARTPPSSAPEQARRVALDLLERAIGTESTARIGCAAYVARWLHQRGPSVSASTLTFYRSALNSWLKWLTDRGHGDLLMESVSREDIIDWRNAEAARVTAKTANHRLKALRKLLADALRDGYLTKNPAAGLELVRQSRKSHDTAAQRRPFTRDEIRRLLAACESPDWRLMIQFGLQTGQRIGDIARADWRELDLRAATWTLTTGKTGHRLRIPLVGALHRHLLQHWETLHQPPHGPVFPEFVATLRRTNGLVGQLSSAFSHILYRAGLRTTSPFDRVSKKGAKAARVAAGHARREQQPLSFHSLRHTARSWLEEQGQPKSVIDALLGHTGDTGRIYTTISAESLRAAATGIDTPEP